MKRLRKWCGLLVARLAPEVCLPGRLVNSMKVHSRRIQFLLLSSHRGHQERLGKIRGIGASGPGFVVRFGVPVLNALQGQGFCLNLARREGHAKKPHPSKFEGQGTRSSDSKAGPPAQLFSVRAARFCYDPTLDLSDEVVTVNSLSSRFKVEEISASISSIRILIRRSKVLCSSIFEHSFVFLTSVSNSCASHWNRSLGMGILI
jgi:hypothetical protein